MGSKSYIIRNVIKHISSLEDIWNHRCIGKTLKAHKKKQWHVGLWEKTRRSLHYYRCIIFIQSTSFTLHTYTASIFNALSILLLSFSVPLRFIFVANFYFILFLSVIELCIKMAIYEQKYTQKWWVSSFNYKFMGCVCVSGKSCMQNQKFLIIYLLLILSFLII